MGTRIEGKTGLGFGLSDAYGGEMKSKLGIVRIEGMDIRLATMCNKMYVARIVQNGIDLVLNTAALTAGIVSVSEANTLDPDKAKAYAMTGLSLGLASKATTLVGPVMDLWFGEEKNRFDIRDGTQMGIKLLDIIRTLGSIACNIVEWIFKSEGREKELREKPWIRDSIYMAFTVTDYAATLIAAGWITWKNKRGITHDSVIYMDGSSIYKEAYDFHDFKVSSREGNTAVAAISEEKYVDTIEKYEEPDLRNSNEHVHTGTYTNPVEIPTKEKIIGTIMTAGFFLAAASVSVGAGITKDKELEEELKSL